MSDKPDRWLKLARWARQAPVESVMEAPFGFSARVVARWSAGDVPENGWLWELFSRRALALASALMIVSVGLNYDWFNDTLTTGPAFSPGSVELFLEP
jgi:hypothetical protein